MTNDELRRRLVEDLPLCPYKHGGKADPQGDGTIRYSLSCADETLASVVLDSQEEPAPWFERWSRQHQYEVARGFLHRLLVTEEPDAVETRLATLEEQVASLTARMVTAEQRLQGNLAL